MDNPVTTNSTYGHDLIHSGLLPENIVTMYDAMMYLRSNLVQLLEVLADKQIDIAEAMQLHTKMLETYGDIIDGILEGADPTRETAG